MVRCKHYKMQVWLCGVEILAVVDSNNTNFLLSIVYKEVRGY